MKKNEIKYPHTFHPTGHWDGAFCYYHCIHCGKTYHEPNPAPIEPCPAFNKFIILEKRRKMKLINFSKPTLGKEEEKAVVDTLRSGWIAAGPKTEKFEKEFAKYVGVKYAIFTNSCTSALKMAYKYYFEQRGIIGYRLNSWNTFCATYTAAEEMGMFREGVPFITTNIHYGGVKVKTPCDIEDSAHRIEKNDPLVGKIRCYSFYATKNMTCGSGGMFTTDSKKIYERVRLYWQDGISSSTYQRQRGQGWNYDVKVASGGYDGNDIAAAIGLEQLKKLPQFTRKRNAIRDRYNQAFETDWGGNHLYCYFVKNEKEVVSLISFLQKKGIGCGYHYPHTGWLGVSLPIYPLLTNKEQDYVIKEIKEWRKNEKTRD